MQMCLRVVGGGNKQPLSAVEQVLEAEGKKVFADMLSLKIADLAGRQDKKKQLEQIVTQPDEGIFFRQLR